MEAGLHENPCANGGFPFRLLPPAHARWRSTRRQQPSLVSYNQKRYDHSGKKLFGDTNAWFALFQIFTDVLQDPGLDGTPI